MALKAQEAFWMRIRDGETSIEEKIRIEITSMIRGSDSAKRREVTGGLRLKEERARGVRRNFMEVVVSRIRVPESPC
jgi:hypothetical protein